MKKYLILFVFLLSFFTFPQNLFAVSNRDFATRSAQLKNTLELKLKQREQQRLDKIQTLKERIQSKTATREAKLNDLKKNIIRNRYQKINKRFQATIERLRNISSRINKRLLELKEQGENVDLLLTKVTKAVELLDKTSDNLTVVEAGFEELLASDHPLSAFKYLKDQYTLMKNDLKQAHSLLVEVITQIKGLRSTK